MSKSRKHGWQIGDVAECDVDHYSSLPRGTQIVVQDTHHHEGRLVLDFIHPRYGRSSYYAHNFINLSRKMPLFDHERKNKMERAHIAIKFEIEGESHVSALNRAALGKAHCIVEASKSELQQSLRRQLAAYPDERWMVLVAIEHAFVRNPTPPVVFQPI